MIRDEIAKRLKYYRQKKHLTVYEVGERLGKSGKTVSAWETGRGQPDADMLINLCRLYDIRSIGELYGESQLTSNTQMTDQEIEHIKKYRELDQRGQQAVDDTLNRELSYTKKVSIDTKSHKSDDMEIAQELVDITEKDVERIKKSDY